MSVTAIVFLVAAAFASGVWVGDSSPSDDSEPTVRLVLIVASHLVAILSGAYLLLRGMFA